jgi:hypothetical protein
VGDHACARFEQTSEVLDRAFFERMLPDADIVFLEGAEVEGAIRVLVAGEARSPAELKRPVSEVDVLLSKTAFPSEGPRKPRLFHPDEIGDFIDFLEAQHGS